MKMNNSTVLIAIVIQKTYFIQGLHNLDIGFYMPLASVYPFRKTGFKPQQISIEVDNFNQF